MTKIEKAGAILGLVVLAAKAIGTLAEVWEQVGPKVKEIIKPVVNECKKIAEDSKKDDENDKEPALIEVIENK